MAARRGCHQLEEAMIKILQGLNNAQKAAVTSSAPVLQVLAPPGSGKTKTLTSRVAYLLAHEQYAPWNVICCTFTIKASREMRERLRGMIGEELESKLILGTFHSVCRRYLVNYGHLIGIPKNFGVADSDDSLNIIKRAVKRLKLSIDPKVARSRISHRKARGQRIEDQPKSTHKNINAQEFATVFQEYEDTLLSSNLLDYDDLLMRCVDLLRQHPQCVSNIETLLIDEFQDTNIIQFELMKLLASSKRRITIVGDPDQSIYGFRSAEIENLRRMRAFYPETAVINLEENYRSASSVLKLAQEVIEQDSSRPQKKLKSTHRYGTLPVLRRLPNPHEEAQWVVSEIKRMTSMTGNLIQHNDIAILLRSAFLSLLIEKALANAGIPYRMVGGRRFFDRVEVRILLDYLRTISHPDNASALLAVINTPARKIGDTTVKELTRVAEERKESLWSICKKVLNGQPVLDKKLSKPAEQGLGDLVALVNKARKKMETLEPIEAPGKLIELVIAHLGYQNFLKKQYPEDHEERWENVKELLTQATDTSLRFNVLDDELPIVDGVVQEKANGAQEVLSRFLANVVLSTEVESNKEGEVQPRITISTIHSAKGLEWPVVFVPAVYEGSIPHSRAEDTDEERRLLYVAMTRAQALLYMTFPIMQSRDDSESILSQFLPSNITPLISQTGPLFGDRVVEDIASILRRSPPSQESIAKGHLSVREHESQLDDIWPEDGSHKRSFAASQSDPMSFVLRKGQSLSDALKFGNSYSQRSNFSTHANNYQSASSIPTTMTDIAAYSTSNTSTGFTTANQHLRTMPTQSTREESRPSLLKSASEGTEKPSKKPRLNKSTSGQGSISTFFGNKNTNTERVPSQPAVFSEKTKHENDLTASTMSAMQRALNPEPSIPAELSQHKLSHTSLLGKRPCRSTNNVADSSVKSGNTRKYPFLSDSPPRDQHPKANLDSHDQSENLAPASQVGSNREYDEPAIRTVTTKLTQNASSKTVTAMTSIRSNSFHSSQLSRIGTLTPLNNMNGTIGMQNVGVPKRTLGMRRSMNGWESRKNK